MARLAPFLKDLSTLEHRVAAADALMAHVYGPFSPAWQPRPLADTKSRYLWTDAFGVVNYISLAAETGKSHYLDQADALIKAVHGVLGRERPGGAHAARLDGATADHPTAGGLRIGKVADEGYPDGDGQYYHYLTKWAFALNRMTLARGDPVYNTWAAELLAAAHPRFVRRPAGGGPPHMVWKLSIDMNRPVVPSEGNLDPYDGLVTVRLVRAAAADPGAVLAAEEADFEEMVAAKYHRYTSTDPLDLGEALWLTHWAAEEPWAAEVARRSAAGLDALWNDGYFREPAGFRLAFRELGTTLGVQVNAAAGAAWRDSRAPALHAFWAPRLLERDAGITPVMMAASLVPGAWDRRFEPRLRSPAEKK